MAESRRLRALAAALAFAACSRPVASGAPDSAGPVEAVPPASAPPPSAEPPAASAPPSSAPPARPPLPPAPSGEARRSVLPGFEREPLLRAQQAALREHFQLDGGAARGPYAVQRAELAEGTTALLVTRPDGSDPMVLVVDREQLVWSKTRPTAGITPPLKHPAITPGPEGGVALFGYVASMRLVASRMWADDANPYAETEVVAVDECDALSAAYSRGMGWIVACSSKLGTRAQRLREDLTSAWGHEGVAVGSASPVERAALAFDTPATWTLVQRARAVGGDHVLTYHYDADARQLGAVGDVRAASP